MSGRVAEDLVRTRRFGPKVRLRVDLHGVSMFGPGDEHRVVRWEWMQEIEAGDGVVIHSSRGEMCIPREAFGLRAEALAERLRAARVLDQRTAVIESLNRR